MQKKGPFFETYVKVKMKMIPFQLNLILLTRGFIKNVLFGQTGYKKSVLLGLFKILVVFSCLFLAYITLPPRIGILYICTGRYTVFFDDFYKSMEENFLPGYSKTYFIFTDDMVKEFPKNVVRIYQPSLPWPYPTLDRFEMFLSVEKQLKKYDYLYFLNANAQILKPIGSEIFPSKEQGITVALHPVYKVRGRSSYTYETRPESTAYIAPNKGKYYVQGGFNGGRTRDYLLLARVCSKNIQIDKENNIIAVWHDESHLNKYVVDKMPLVLGPEYVWEPSQAYGAPVPNPIKILMRDKGPYGGYDYLRGISNHK